MFFLKPLSATVLLTITFSICIEAAGYIINFKNLCPKDVGNLKLVVKDSNNVELTPTSDQPIDSANPTYTESNYTVGDGAFYAYYEKGGECSSEDTKCMEPFYLMTFVPGSSSVVIYGTTSSASIISALSGFDTSGANVNVTRCPSLVATCNWSDCTPSPINCLNPDAVPVFAIACDWNNVFKYSFPQA